jgi:hypothetical protein
MDVEITRRARREERQRLARVITARQFGVASRRQLLQAGISRWEIEAELRAGRWHGLGRQAIGVAAGPEAQATWWRAVFEVGPGAVLDGVSALQAVGMHGLTDTAVHVAVPKSTRWRRCRGVVVHETRRYEIAGVVHGDIPRMRPEVAAVHAALWARTDREAAFLILAAAQQRLFAAEELGAEIAKVRRDKRLKLLRSLHADVVGGIQAVSERDFAQLCAVRGFPEPVRQHTCRLPSGRTFLDVTWDEFAVSVEVDGVQHLEPAAWIRDALKQNATAMSGYVVLRVPALALRLDPDPFLDQVAAALTAGGWRRCA